MKKLISVLLVLTMSLSLCLGAFAEDTTVDDILSNLTEEQKEALLEKLLEEALEEFGEGETEEIRAAIKVTKTADTTSCVKAGETVTYTITVENTGNVTVSNLAVTDPLPGDPGSGRRRLLRQAVQRRNPSGRPQGGQ